MCQCVSIASTKVIGFFYDANKRTTFYKYFSNYLNSTLLTPFFIVTYVDNFRKGGLMLFNLSERKGVIICLVVITATIIIPRQLLPKEHNLFLLTPPIEVTPIAFNQIPTTTKLKANSQANNVNTKAKAQEQAKQFIPLELNSADSVSLIRLRGIGAYYASKILKYRERLGGFQSVKQLNDLKMTYFNVDSLAHLFTVDTSLIRKVDMDSMSFKAILRHPYLEYEDVQMIFNAKRKHGKISYKILEKYKILANFKLKNIKPYFK